MKAAVEGRRHQGPARRSLPQKARPATRHALLSTAFHSNYVEIQNPGLLEGAGLYRDGRVCHTEPDGEICQRAGQSVK